MKMLENCKKIHYQVNLETQNKRANIIVIDKKKELEINPTIKRETNFEDVNVKKRTI